jgi:hypothetical protein
MKTLTAVAILVALAAGAAPCAPAGLDRLDGNGLLDYCTTTAEKRVGCVGYVLGYADATVILPIRDYLRNHNARDDALICIPSDFVKAEQMVDVVVTYLKAHPETLYLGAGTLVAEALEEAWPCKK